MHADMDRALGRAFTSYYIKYVKSIVNNGHSINIFLGKSGFKAYDLEHLDPIVKEFLDRCDRSESLAREHNLHLSTALINLQKTFDLVGEERGDNREFLAKFLAELASKFSDPDFQKYGGSVFVGWPATLKEIVDSPEEIDIDIEINIKNQDNFPNADFLNASQIRPIGDIGGTRLVLLGWDDDDSPLVASSYSEPFDVTDEEFFAVPLQELLKHAQEPVNITEKLN